NVADQSRAIRWYHVVHRCNPDRGGNLRRWRGASRYSNEGCGFLRKLLYESATPRRFATRIAQKASAEGALRFLCAVWRDDSHWESLCARQIRIRASNGDLDIAAHALGWKREIDGPSELVRNEPANKIGAITGFARSLWGRAASLPPRNRQ